MAKNGWKQLLLPFLMLLLCAVHEAHEENVIVRGRSEQRKPLWALPWLLPSPSSCDSSNPVCAEGQVTYISACHALADHAIILSPGVLSCFKSTVPNFKLCMQMIPVGLGLYTISLPRADSSC